MRLAQRRVQARTAGAARPVRRPVSRPGFCQLTDGYVMSVSCAAQVVTQQTCVSEAQLPPIVSVSCHMSLAVFYPYDFVCNWAILPIDDKLNKLN